MNTHPAKIGYARISTANQNLDAQIAAHKALECSMIRSSQGSGASPDDATTISVNRSLALFLGLAG